VVSGELSVDKNVVGDTKPDTDGEVVVPVTTTGTAVSPMAPELPMAIIGKAGATCTNKQVACTYYVALDRWRGVGQRRDATANVVKVVSSCATLRNSSAILGPKIGQTSST